MRRGWRWRRWSAPPTPTAGGGGRGAPRRRQRGGGDPGVPGAPPGLARRRVARPVRQRGAHLRSRADRAAPHPPPQDLMRIYLRGTSPTLAQGLVGLLMETRDAQPGEVWLISPWLRDVVLPVRGHF